MGAKVFWNKTPNVFKDPAYLQWLHDTQSCMVCGNRPIEVHHLKSDRKRNDNDVICLCAYHHRGSKLSPHGTPKLWRETYPNQKEIAKRLYNQYLQSGA